jgi:MATE family multidrug resistance protein
MIAIAAPTVATMTSYTLMQFVDGFMVSRIGPDPVYVAAQGNGNVASFVPISIVMGLLTVINTYVSQNLGAGRPERGAAYAWNGLWLAFFGWLLLIPYGFLLPRLFTLAGHSEYLHRLESANAQILVFGSLVTMATRGIAQYFYGMHRPKAVLVAAVTGNIVNFAFNGLLVFGPVPPTPTGSAAVDAWLDVATSISRSLHLPALGVAGSAAATIIGSAVELSIPMFVFLSPSINRRLHTRAAWRPSATHIKDLIRIGWPGALMFGNEMFCWAYLMAVLIGRFGELHNTAGWIALRYMHLAFMPAIGLSIAVTAMVGKCMGMGRPDLAARRAYLGLALTMSYMGLCALLMVLFREPAIALFIDPASPPESRAALIRIGSEVMIAAAIFQLFDALGITFIGALRGAGDTIWPGVATIVLAWTCLIGLGHALAYFFPNLGSLGPWIGASVYIILLGVFVAYRFVSGRWKAIKLVERAPATPTQA